MKIAWSLAVPAAQVSVEPPPVPSLIDHYLIGYDESRKATYYVCPRDDEKRGTEVWSFDGTSWSTPYAKRFDPMNGRVEGGGYDSVRRGIVLWTFQHDYQLKKYRIFGWVADADGVTTIEMHGDEPEIEAAGNDDIGTFDKHGTLAFDRAREVWVCLTRCGVWELDASNAWSKKHDGAGVPREWHGESGEGTYDPVGKRCVFSIQDGGAEDGYPILLFAWNGSTIGTIPTDALGDMCIGLFNPAVQIGGHPRHGLIAQVGAQMWASDGRAWKELPAAEGAPPKMERGRLAYDAKLDAMILGPGKHEKAGGSDYQRVFFFLRNGRWERQGKVVTHSALKNASYGNCRLAHVGGVWYGTGTHSLRTWRFSVPNWDEIVDKKVGEAIGGWEILYLLPGEQLRALTQSGAVFAFDGTKWKSLRKADPAFKKRTDFAFAQDGSGRLVVWGGEANGRKLNDTLFLEGTKWRAAKKSSPQPADFKHGNKDGVYVGTTMIWDSALGAFVRFGFEEAFVLGADEIWSVLKLKNYKSLVSERAYGHTPVHDPATGETLLVDFEKKRVLRFDLAGLTEVATFDYPAAIEPKKPHDKQAHHWLCESFSWDPSTRSLVAQVLEDSAGVYRLDLGPVFDHASTLGPRKLLAPPSVTAPTKGAAKDAPTFEATRIYRLHKGVVSFVAFEPNAKGVKVTAGVFGTKGTTKVVKAADATKALAAKRKEGFRPARELPRDALLALASRPSAAVKVGKPLKSGAPPKSRLGGVPSLVAGAAWPKVRKRPLGFLFQIETGALLKKHAGVAVFCSLDGEATTEEDENAVVLLRKADFAKKGKTPDGVPVLPPRPLTIEASKAEIDETLAHALGDVDADFLAAIEAVQTSKGIQTDHLAQKVGGVPTFLQGEMELKGWTFVVQLDFDGIDVSKAWPSAGLSGCVYVFVKDDEKDALAIWQYT